MGKSAPPPPAAPDYAAANREAINADIDTLGLRNAINAASTLGRSYTDPDTGKTYDFTGLGSQDVASAQLMQQLRDAPAATQAMLDLNRQFGSQFAQESRNQLRETDPTGFALRDQLGGRLSGGSNSIEGLYNPGQSTANYEAYVRNNPDLLANWENNTSQNTGMSLADYGRQHYEAAGRTEGRALPMSAGTPGSTPPNYEQIAGNGPALQNIGAGPAFQSLGDARAAETIGLDSLPGFAGLNNAAAGERLNLSSLPAMTGVGGTRLADTGATAAGRTDLERQIFDELGRAGQPDAALQRSAEQAARARGAASGNILGDSSALQESLGVQLAQRQLDAGRRNDALGLLQSGQGVSDTNNRLQLAQQQSDIAAAGFNNTAKGQALSQLMAAIGQNNATNTQDLANQQSVAGFNNANAQQGMANRLAASGFNNQASQQDFANRGQAAQFNNANAQQSYANASGATAQNNDTANQAFNNAMSAIGQRNQAAQNTFGAQQGMIQQRAGARQQDLANIQSFLGLQPIVSQGSQLSGLQQGASPFMSGTGYQAQGVNQNAGQQGAEWAGQLYGAQNQFLAGTTASKNAATGGAISGIGGAAMGIGLAVF